MWLVLELDEGQTGPGDAHLFVPHVLTEKHCEHHLVAFRWYVLGEEELGGRCQCLRHCGGRRRRWGGGGGGRGAPPTWGSVGDRLLSLHRHRPPCTDDSVSTLDFYVLLRHPSQRLPSSGGRLGSCPLPAPLLLHLLAERPILFGHPVGLLPRVRHL